MGLKWDNGQGIYMPISLPSQQVPAEWCANFILRATELHVKGRKFFATV